MSMYMQEYLFNIASKIEVKNKTITFTLKCNCGNSSFILYKNEESIEEYKKKKNGSN